MHDTVHDFAQFLRNNERKENPRMKDERSCQFCDPFLVSRVKEYRSLFWDKETPLNNCECLARLKVLILKTKLNSSLEGMGNMIRLQWLDIRYTKLSKEDLKNICKLYFLQSLVLQECSIKEISSEIGNLIQLRYLDLSENEELRKLPEIICSLFRLQTLNVQWCDISELPEGIHRLENLKHLHAGDTPASLCFPQTVGELSGLRTLRHFCGGSGWNKMRLLNKLNRLTGFLELEIKVGDNSDLVELVKDAGEAGLRNKIHLLTLYIVFKDQIKGEEEPLSSSSSLWVDVIEALEPHHNLNFLKINGYMGWRLPHWISSPLNHVRDIELKNLFRISSLPPMGKLPFLESLGLLGLRDLKVVGEEWLGIRGSSCQGHIPSSSSSSTNSLFVAFPKLKHLTFYECMHLEEWKDITAEEEESAAIQLMPSLIRLYINNCGRLKKLPHRLLHKTNSLKKLGIQGSSELKKIYGDKEGSSWRSISQNNTQLQLLID